MGKISNGIMGGFSGTVGPVVGSSWNGLSVMRSRPPKKRKNDSPAQRRQQQKFALVTNFLSPLTSLLNQTFNGTNVGMSRFNKAYSYNVLNAIMGEDTTLRINYPMVLLGRGDLPNVTQTSISIGEDGMLVFTWNDNSGIGVAKGTDMAYVAVYCEAIKQWKYRSGSTQRKAGTDELNVSLFKGHKLQTWLGFISADGRYVTNSLYTGEVNFL